MPVHVSAVTRYGSLGYIIDVSTRLVPPVLVMVNVCGAEIVPVLTLPKLNVSGETCIFGPAAPFPLRLTVTVVSSASFDVITVVALKEPAAVGENFTLT
jgi:hypothetical protein